MKCGQCPVPRVGHTIVEDGTESDALVVRLSKETLSAMTLPSHRMKPSASELSDYDILIRPRKQLRSITSLAAQLCNVPMPSSRW